MGYVLSHDSTLLNDTTQRRDLHHTHTYMQPQLRFWKTGKKIWIFLCAPWEMLKPWQMPKHKKTLALLTEALRRELLGGCGSEGSKCCTIKLATRVRIQIFSHLFLPLVSCQALISIWIKAKSPKNINKINILYKTTRLLKMCCRIWHQHNQEQQITGIGLVCPVHFTNAWSDKDPSIPVYCVSQTGPEQYFWRCSDPVV